VAYKTGFWIGFIARYTFTQYKTKGNTALSLFYTLSSSPLHTHARAHTTKHTHTLSLSLSLGFSVFTSRILATDL
jgi:hypothetical protein